MKNIKTKLSCSPRTAVAYARYSSAGQRDVSIDQQLKDIRAYAEREGFTLVHEYCDHARSGFKNVAARTEFQAMISAAEKGSFDTVLCWKVDRFGRNREDSVTYKSHLSRLGVSVVYVMEPIPDGSAGMLTESMLEALAEWYSRNLSENVTRGLNDNAYKCISNGTKILGYRRGPDGHYEIDPDQAAIVRTIFERYISGYSARAICSDLNALGLRSAHGHLFRPQYLMRIISNERYTGVYIWGDIRVPDGMPVIIPESDFKEAQRMKNKTSRHYESSPVDYLLTGKAFCGYCGRSMVGDSGTSATGNTYYYYSCQGKKTRTGCHKKTVRKQELEDFVVDYLVDVVLTDTQIQAMADLVAKEMAERKKKSPLAAMKQELSEVKTKIDNTNRAIAAGIFSTSTAEMLKELEETAKDLKTSISFAEYAESQLLDPDRCLFLLHKFAHINKKNERERRRLINVFLNSVYVYDDHLKIIVNAEEGTSIVPFEDIPADFESSDSVPSGRLVGTHPNSTAIMFVARI